jgi:hypothetical protein
MGVTYPDPLFLTERGKWEWRTGRVGEGLEGQRERGRGRKEGEERKVENGRIWHMPCGIPKCATV